MSFEFYAVAVLIINFYNRIIPCEIKRQMILYKSDSLSPAGDNHYIIPGLRDDYLKTLLFFFILTYKD